MLVWISIQTGILCGFAFYIAGMVTTTRKITIAIARKHGITYEEMRTGDDMGSRLEAEL